MTRPRPDRTGTRAPRKPSERPRAAIYARISLDKSGEGAGVERQLADLRKLAKAEGWLVVEEIVDNDVSAYSTAKRPGYSRLLDLVESDALDIVAAWHSSRLWRKTLERAEALDLLAGHRVDVKCVSGPSFDLSTATGRSVAVMLGEIDTMESAIKSERVAAATAQRVAAGRSSGGLGYGWRRISTGEWEKDPDAAPIVREIVTRIGAGETLRGITDDLNDRGIPAPGATYAKPKRGRLNPTGTKWAHSSVKKIAERPSNIAKVQHRGEIVADGSWPPLVTEKQYDRALVALERIRTTRAPNPTGQASRKHLLSRTDVAVCGVCGGPLRGQTKRGKYGKPLEIYICEAGCVGRGRAPVDELVTAVALERLSRDDVSDLLASEPIRERLGTERELDDLRARLADLDERYTAGKVTPTTYDRLVPKLERQIASLEESTRALKVSTAAAAHALTPFTGRRKPATVWESLDVTGRLAVLEALGLRVRILPRERRGPGFEPETVEIGWAS